MLLFVCLLFTDYFFAVTVPPQEAFLPQPPAGVARLHLNPHKEILLLTVTAGRPSLPSMVKLWSFDSIASFGATDSVLVIQTSRQTDAKNYCCFITPTAEEIADHLGRLMPEEGVIYDSVVGVESGSGDSSCNGSGDEAEGGKRDVAEKDRKSRLRSSYLKAVDRGSDSEVLTSTLQMLQDPNQRSLSPPLPTSRKKLTTKWKRKDSPIITVTSEQRQSATQPVAHKGAPATVTSPLQSRVHGSGGGAALPSEAPELLVGPPSDRLSISPAPGDTPRSPSPIKRLKKLKRWLSPNLTRKGTPKVPAAEIPSASLEQVATLIGSWEEGVTDRENPVVSPLPSPFLQRKLFREPVEPNSHFESGGRSTPNPPPIVSPPHSTVSSDTERSTPDLPAALQSTSPDEDSIQGVEAGHEAGCPSAMSKRESCLREEAPSSTMPALLVGDGEDQLSLVSSCDVSQTDGSQQPSLEESTQLSLPDQSGRPTVPQDPVPQDAHQGEQSLPTRRPLPTQAMSTHTSDRTPSAETSPSTSEADLTSPTHKPLGGVHSESMFVRPESPVSPRRFSADSAQLVPRTRSGSFSELIQTIFVNSLERPGSPLSDRCHSPLSVHSHSISDVSGQLETEVWPEMGTDLDALVTQRDRKGNSLSSVQSPSSHSNTKMASLHSEVDQSSSDPDTRASKEVPETNTFNFQGSLVRLRKVPCKSTDDSAAVLSPPSVPHWRRRSKSASHALPKHNHSFLDRPLPRLPSMCVTTKQVNPPPEVQLESSSEYVNTASATVSLYMNTADAGDDLYANTSVMDNVLYANLTDNEVDKIYDEIDCYQDITGHYATLSFACEAARRFLQEDSKSAGRPAPTGGSEDGCTYATVDHAAMEAARQIADARRTEQEQRSGSQTFSTEDQRRRHATDFSTMRAGGPKARRPLRRAASSVGLVNEQIKTHSE